VDGERACIAGGSYGGYSALISVIRKPSRYRCAASLNGPMDLPFEYHFYFSWWDEAREYFEEYIGDPDDLDQLRENSPVYRAAEIRVPVLLVQGMEDRRVDVDHAYRMMNVLEALRSPHEVHLVSGMGHVPSPSQWIDFAVRLRKFLLEHLEPR
ncbi:MAG: alpha/beta hydrolase family protein, partial [Myxococcota bacterium]